MANFIESSKTSQSPRALLVIPRMVLGVIFLVTWYENLIKGLYTAEGFSSFMHYLAEGHPLAFYGGFLTNGIAPVAAVLAPLQMSAELLMGLGLLVGAFTPLFGTASILFFANLFLAYLNPSLGEWVWTYVLLLTCAGIVTLGQAGRSFGVDLALQEKFGERKIPVMGLPLW